MLAVDIVSTIARIIRLLFLNNTMIAVLSLWLPGNKLAEVKPIIVFKSVGSNIFMTLCNALLTTEHRKILKHDRILPSYSPAQGETSKVGKQCECYIDSYKTRV